MARALISVDPPSAGRLMNVSTEIPSHTHSGKMIMIAAHSMQMQVYTTRQMNDEKRMKCNC